MKALLALAALLVALAATGTAAESPADVHIAGFAFVPQRLTVAAGARVAFVNDDEEPHTVTAADQSWDSGGLDTHQRFSHTFARAGTYAYVCALHPQMHGTIVVTP